MARHTWITSVVPAAAVIMATAAQSAVVFSDNFEAGDVTGDTVGIQSIARKKC